MPRRRQEQAKRETYIPPTIDEARALEGVLKSFRVSTSLIGAHPVLTNVVRGHHTQEFEGHSQALKTAWERELSIELGKANFPGASPNHLGFRRKREILGDPLAKTVKLVDFVFPNPNAHRRFVEALRLIHPESGKSK